MSKLWQWVVVFALAGTAAADRAEQMLRDGSIDEAITAVQQRLAARPDDAEAHNLLARAHFAVHQYDAAIRAAERAVQLAPQHAQYRLWLGRAYGRKAETSSWFSAASLARKMRAELERAVQLDGADVSARSDLAEFYIEAPAIVGGGKAKAEKQAQAVERRDAATAHWIRARIAEKDERHGAAEAEYKAAIQDSGGRADNWLSLASFYRRRNRLPEMEAAVQNAISSPNKAAGKSALFDAATLLIRAGRQTTQAAQLLKAYLASSEKVEDAPAFQAHYLLGVIHEKQGDRAAATREFQAALRLAKDFRDAREALGRMGAGSAAGTTR